MLVTISCSPLRTSLVSSATLLYRKQIILTTSMSVYYNTNSFFLRRISHLCSDCWSVQFINSEVLKFHCFMLLLNFVTSKYSYSEELFRLRTSIYKSLATVPALRCPALWLYWGIWLIYLSSLWKVFSVLLSFFAISNNNIHYLFPEICDLSGNFWSEAPFPVL